MIPFRPGSPERERWNHWWRLCWVIAGVLALPGLALCIALQAPDWVAATNGAAASFASFAYCYPRAMGRKG